MAKPLNRPMMSWFFDNYLGLPPTTIINAQIDPLRSDGEMLAQRLRAAGVRTQQKTYPGVNHEFFGMGAAVADAMAANQFAADALKAGFGG